MGRVRVHQGRDRAGGSLRLPSDEGNLLSAAAHEHDYSLPGLQLTGAWFQFGCSELPMLAANPMSAISVRQQEPEILRCPAPSCSSWIHSASAGPKMPRISATPARTPSATSPRPALRGPLTGCAGGRSTY